MRSQIKRYSEQDMWEGNEACLCSACRSLAPSCVHQSRSSPLPVLLGCYTTCFIAWLIINSVFSPLFLKEWGVGLKIPSFYSWLNLSCDLPSCRSHLGSRSESPQGTLVTQEITWVSKALVRSWRQETNIQVYIVYFLTLLLCVFYLLFLWNPPVTFILWWHSDSSLANSSPRYKFNMCLYIPP